MLTLKENPPMLSPDEASIEEIQGTWWVAHTRPRQEKALAWDILRAGGQYFLPMYEATRRSRGRKWNTWLPLFSGYVFICGEEEDRLAALKTNRVANMIDVVDQRRLVGELASLRRLIETPSVIDPYPGFAKGDRCRIRKGPMVGLEGVVERRKGKMRFVINVSVLGQGAAVEIDADFLEPAG